MKVIRESTHISGFLYDRPVASLPALTHCGEALCAQGHTVALHHHVGFEFHYLARGGPFAWQVGHLPLHHQVGELSVTYPGESHQTGPDTYPETQFLWIGLDLDKLGPDGRRLARQLVRGQIRIIRGCLDLESLLRGMITQIINQKPDRANVVLHYVMTFMALVNQTQRADTSPVLPSVPLVPYSHTTMKAVAYLESHLDRRVPLSELTAVAACRGITNFCTQFKREVGTTPSAFHRRLRLQAARQALRQPSFSITTVAFQFGFNSSQHFSTCYRREYGVTPRGLSRAKRGS